MASLKELTMELQALVGVTVDGVYGPKTASAAIELIKTVIHDAEPVVETSDASFEDLYPDDLVNSEVHRICVQTLNVFETGSTKGDYSNVSIYADGPNNQRQLTYGASQTTESGNLKKLLTAYLALNPTTEASSVIADRAPTVGQTPYKVNDKEFINALKAAGKEEKMVQAQDKFFDTVYFNPAYKWFHTNGFTLPLSMLIIYDSFIHSGGILSFLRKRFAEAVPSNGGDEKTWCSEYVRVRRDWLANHSNKVLRSTVYRMDTMKQAMKDDNWMLDKPVYANGVVVK